MAGSLCVGNDAWASSINIDFDYLGFGNAPSSTYGAASGQAGIWNEVTTPTLGGPIGLVDLVGAASGATISALAPGFNSSNPYAVAGDDAFLLEDFFYSFVGVPYSVSVTGLQNGLYDVYLYASAVNVGTGDGSVNGVAFTNAQGFLTAPGLILGTHYTVASGVTVNAGTLLVSGQAGQTNYGLSGMQIVARTPTGLTPVPEPATMLLVGSGLVAAIRRRARRGK